MILIVCAHSRAFIDNAQPAPETERAEGCLVIGQCMHTSDAKLVTCIPHPRVRLDGMGIEMRPGCGGESEETGGERDGRLVRGRWSEEESGDEAGWEEALRWWRKK